jgi:hypothetical protein
MKKFTSPWVLLLAAIVGLAMSLPAIAADNAGPVMYRVKQVVLNGALYNGVLAIGSTKTAVRWELASPNLQPSPDVWIYYNFTNDRADANELGCTNLVFTFKGEVVTDIRVVNQRAVGVILARADAMPKTTPGVLLAGH